MDFKRMVDEEIMAAVSQIPEDFVSAIGDKPQEARAAFQALLAQMADLFPEPDVDRRRTSFAGPGGDVDLYIYEPHTEAPRPALLWLHGGGYVIGEGDDAAAAALAEGAGCTVVSVDYRLAPEHPFPAGPEDAHAALRWTVENARELAIDPARVAIGGSSAGGGMAAGVALMNRDRGGPALRLQLLLYPMIDHTHDTPSGHWVHHPQVWNREVSLKAWKMYLGEQYEGEVSPYAAAARAADLSGLPPALITVGQADLFRDENIAYAQRLMAAGVPTELHVYPGMLHGGEDFNPMAAVSQQMRADYVAALQRALA